MNPFQQMIILQAETVATVAHSAIGQKRRYTDEPYINHPRAVVKLLKQAKDVDHEMIAAAWLHDVLEDTHITHEQIHDWFGPGIYKMVADLTNCPLELGNRQTRFEINRDRLAISSPRVKTIKVCDLIHNTSSIVEHDPKFAKLYLKEKRELLEVALREADLCLWAQAYGMVQ